MSGEGGPGTVDPGDGDLVSMEQAALVFSIAGCCADCGWTYPPYRGHLEPCPRCTLEEARHVIAHLVDALLLREPKYAARHRPLMDRVCAIVGAVPAHPSLPTSQPASGANRP